MDIEQYQIDPNLAENLKQFLLLLAENLDADVETLTEQFKTLQSYDDFCAIMNIIFEAEAFDLGFVWPDTGDNDYHFSLHFRPEEVSRTTQTILQFLIEVNFKHPELEQGEGVLVSTTIDRVGTILNLYGVALNGPQSTYEADLLEELLQMINAVKDEIFTENMMAIGRSVIASYNPRNDPKSIRVQDQAFQAFGGPPLDTNRVAFTAKLAERAPVLLQILEQTLQLPEQSLVDVYTRMAQKAARTNKPLTMGDVAHILEGHAMPKGLSFWGDITKQGYISFACAIPFYDTQNQKVGSLNVAVGANGSTVLAFGKKAFCLIANHPDGKASSFSPDACAVAFMPSDVRPEDVVERNKQTVKRALIAFNKMAPVTAKSDCERALRRILRTLA